MLCCAVGGFGGKGGRAEAGRNTVWNSLQELLREDDRVAGFRLHALRTHTTLSLASSAPFPCSLPQSVAFLSARKNRAGVGA